jgi:hypothetical protein
MTTNLATGSRGLSGWRQPLEPRPVGEYAAVCAQRFEAPAPKGGRVLRIVRNPLGRAYGVIEIEENGVVDTYHVRQLLHDGPSVSFEWQKVASTAPADRARVGERYTATVEAVEGYESCGCNGAKYRHKHGNRPCRHCAASRAIIARNAI